MRADLRYMTQAKWDSLTPAEKARLVDLGGLHPLLVPHEGHRVEVIYSRPYACLLGPERMLERFRVSRSTGWRPCSLALHNTRSTGGYSVPKEAPIAYVKRVAR